MGLKQLLKIYIFSNGQIEKVMLHFIHYLNTEDNTTEKVEVDLGEIKKFLNIYLKYNEVFQNTSQNSF